MVCWRHQPETSRSHPINGDCTEPSITPGCIKHPYPPSPFQPPTTKGSRESKAMGLFLHPRLTPLAIILCLSLCFLSAAGDDTPSAYEVMQQYGFPIGLLPKGVTGYDLDVGTGEFSAYLSGTCGFRLKNSYEMEYKPTIKGVISKDRLEKLSGVRVKVALVWFNIVEVTRNDGELRFSAGVASANFPVRNFEECPQCGRGMDCDT